MEKVMTRNQLCAVITDAGVGVNIEYLGKYHTFPEVENKSRTSYPALIPGWKPPMSRKKKSKIK